jgi:FkbM family methyltransferase
MEEIIKKIFKKSLFKKIVLYKKKYIDKYSKKFYSQDGEDIILREFLKNRKEGFYVDIGAHHPFRFSNTYLFYKKGWKGINIDAMPNSMKLFDKYRKRDINLELGVSKKSGFLTYYMFNESAINGFSKELSKKRDSKSINKLIGTKKIKTAPLKLILDKYLPKNQKIDFMNIDVEGTDYEVLKSNEWNKYCPTFVLIEILDKNLKEISKDKIYKFLKNKNYELVAKTYRTCIFKKIKNEN